MRSGRVGGLVGVVVIVAVWWLASLVLFQGSGSIPPPPSVLAKFFDAGQWAATLNNARSTDHVGGQGYLWGNLAAIALAVLVLLVPLLEPMAQPDRDRHLLHPARRDRPDHGDRGRAVVAEGRFGRAGRAELLLHHGRRLPARAAGGPAGEPRPGPGLRRHRMDSCARCS